MKVLVGCEYSGRVRDAFISRGHYAISCDILPTENPGPHYQGDIMDIISDQWDMMIAFPPCTRICNTGNSRWAGTKERAEAIEFVRTLMKANIKYIAIENSIGQISSRIRKPDQIIQPWWFGDPWQKATCLWLKNLPKLTATKIVKVKYYNHDLRNGRDPQNSHERSLTYQGIANAMSEQWGELDR
jgi:site-specific DNA-cytosine methylase